jgi:hypothetical protein
MSLGIRTPREKILRIRDVVKHNNMLGSYGFTDEEHNEVIRYIEINADKLREISLRTVLKVADLRKAVPSKWNRFADKNVLKDS